MHTCWSPLASAAAGLFVMVAAPAGAQSPPSQDGVQYQHAADQQPANAEKESRGHDMNMSMRDGSGASWLPDATPMYAFHALANGWTLMAHGSAFLQYLRESGKRGSDQTGSINWLWGRPVATLAAVI